MLLSCFREKMPGRVIVQKWPTIYKVEDRRTTNWDRAMAPAVELAKFKLTVELADRRDWAISEQPSNHEFKIWANNYRHLFPRIFDLWINASIDIDSSFHWLRTWTKVQLQICVISMRTINPQWLLCSSSRPSTVHIGRRSDPVTTPDSGAGTVVPASEDRPKERRGNASRATALLQWETAHQNKESPSTRGKVEIRGCSIPQKQELWTGIPQESSPPPNGKN